MKHRLLFITIAGLTAGHADAFEFRCRWVERVRNTDTPIGGDGAVFSIGDEPHRLRLQLGVFDDAAGPAPAGGTIGWTRGIIIATGGLNYRTPGRIPPFHFSGAWSSNGIPGAPAGDPFTMLTGIDATSGTQSPPWDCDANGQPMPQPPPTIRGLNSFVSVYEITTRPSPGDGAYTITVLGDLIAAIEMRVFGLATPPDCAAGIRGAVTYGPVTAPPIQLDSTLNIQVIPAPAGVAALGAAGFGLAGIPRLRRARRST